MDLSLSRARQDGPCLYVSAVFPSRRPLIETFSHAIEPRFDEFKNEKEKLEGLDETASLSPYRFAALPVKMISAGGFNWENASSAIASRDVDAVAFGRYYTSNPDLVDKIRSKQPWVKYRKFPFKLI